MESIRALSDEPVLSLAIVAPKSAQIHELMAHQLVMHGHTAEAIADLPPVERIRPGRHVRRGESLAYLALY